MTVPTVYADDTDAHVDWPVTDQNGNNLDWPNPTVAIGEGAYDLAATWLGDPSPQRQLRVPLTGLTARTSAYNVYLKVPGGSDIKLGSVHVRARS